MPFQIQAEVIMEGELPAKLLKEWCPWANNISVPRITINLTVVKGYDGSARSSWEISQATHNFRQSLSILAEEEMKIIGFNGVVKQEKNIRLVEI